MMATARKHFARLVVVYWEGLGMAGFLALEDRAVVTRRLCLQRPGFRFSAVTSPGRA